MKLATEPNTAWVLPSAGRTGMLAFIGAEACIFVIFIVAYVFYMGKSTGGPTPEVLELPIFITVCLLSSSVTIELAVHGLKRGKPLQLALWWVLTLVLGATFLGGTLLEWRHLIVDEGLTISTNLFGTTYYSLVGLHASHVAVGLILMAVVAAFLPGKRVTREHLSKLEVLSLYWHFVDSVWVVVFSLVYLVGR